MDSLGSGTSFIREPIALRCDPSPCKKETQLGWQAGCSQSYPLKNTGSGDGFPCCHCSNGIPVKHGSKAHGNRQHSRSMKSIQSLADLLLRALRRAVAFVVLLLLSGISYLTGRTFFLIVTPFGNLGNRLFLYANIMAFAIDNHAIVINPAIHPWRGVFAGSRAGFCACYPKPRMAHIRSDLLEKLIQQLAWAMESVANSKPSLRQWAAIRINDSKATAQEMVNLDSPEFKHWAASKHVILLSGYQFIASTLMQRHSTILREYFHQVVGSSTDAIEPITDLRRSCDIVIGVVIRHSGFQNWMNGKYFFPFSAYLRWIHQALRLQPDLRTGFFLCSDSDQQLDGLDEVQFRFRSGHDLENRAVLARCDMIITPPSSYGAWAAFMANAPILILHSTEQTINLADFKLLRSQVDAADASYPSSVDRTIYHTKQ